MFNIRNVNKLERTILELLSYDTIISSSQVRACVGPHAPAITRRRLAHRREQPRSADVRADACVRAAARRSDAAHARAVRAILLQLTPGVV